MQGAGPWLNDRDETAAVDVLHQHFLVMRGQVQPAGSPPGYGVDREPHVYWDLEVFQST